MQRRTGVPCRRLFDRHQSSLDWITRRIVCSSAASVEESFEDAVKSPVVIFGVVILTRFAGDDSPGSPVPGTRCGYGVFPVIAAISNRQAALSIMESNAILGMLER